MRDLLAIRQTWGLIILRSLTGPLSQFYWFWLPEYLSTGRGLSLEQLGRVVWIPYFCAGLGNIFSGALTGWLQRHGRTVDFSRRLPLFTGALIAAAANLSVYSAPTVGAAVALLSIANFGANMIEPSFIGYFGDFFPPEVVGRVTSLTGVGDNLTSMLLMLTTGIVLDRYSYFPVFMFAAAVPLLMIGCVIFILGNVRRIEL